MPDLSLPMEADSLVPHEPPVRFVARLLEFFGDGGTVEAFVSPENPLLDEIGRADPILMLELMAQAYAVVKGYKERLQGLPPKKGFLVGVKSFRVHEGLRAGDRVLIKLKTLASLGGFTVGEAIVSRGAKEMASGTVKLWTFDGADPEHR